jgi:hypothetical protein
LLWLWRPGVTSGASSYSLIRPDIQWKACGEAGNLWGSTMTAVMLLGDIPSVGVIREVQADRLALPAEITPEATLAVTGHIAQGLQTRGAVLVLYPAWRPEPGVRLVRFARGILRTDRVAGVALELPPVALSLVADQLAYLARYVKPGVVASLAYRLAREVFAGAWVNSVARLEHIQTGIGEHVSSYLPRTGFMVSATPQPGVHRITSAHPVAPITYRPVAPIFLLATREGGDADWLQGELALAVGATSVSFVGGQPLSTEFWGTKRYVEFVAFSGHQYALQNALSETPTYPCPWCGEPTAVRVCPFCSMVQPTPSAARPQPPLSAAQQLEVQRDAVEAAALQPPRAQVPHGSAQSPPAGPGPEELAQPAAVPSARGAVSVRPPPRFNDVEFSRHGPPSHNELPMRNE